MTANGEVKVIAELPRTTDATIFWIVNSDATRIWEAGESLGIGGAITTDHTFKHVKNADRCDRHYCAAGVYVIEAGLSG